MNCDKCEHVLDEDECIIFEELSALESALTADTLKSLVYIAGYLSANTSSDEDTKYYYERYEAHLGSLSRGGLKIPTDKCCQFTAFAYIMFETVKDVTCRKSLLRIFQFITKQQDFQMTDIQCRKLSNNLFKNYSLLCSPHSAKEGSVKVLKLSST